MVNSHSRSFFGQNTGLIIRSSSKKEDFLFFQVIKKKQDGSWEKPSQGEGKVIKLSLEEIVMILKVLRKEKDSWSTYHKYKETRTQISFNWQEGVIWVNINHYSKKLDQAQIEIIRLLLDHLLQEKIEFATSYETDTENVLRVEEEIITAPQEPEKPKTSKNSSTQPKGNKARKTVRSEKEAKDVIPLNASIQRSTAKAVLLQFVSGQEAWIPKSTIHNEFDVQQEGSQAFLIDKWVLENNDIQCTNG